MTKQRLALCVGLNYPGTNAELAGCVNDALDWSETLSRRGYTVRMLIEPDKATLAHALALLIDQARFGSRVIFTFSGHGTWIPDMSGDEADGRDEALCCRDFHTGGVLTDDEIQAIFSRARHGVRRTIISDSCHSGSVSRFSGFVGKPAPGQQPTIATPRYLPPSNVLPPELLERAQRVEHTTARSVSRKGTVLISGCADVEYSYDATFGGRPNGALTYHAIETLKTAKTIKGWHEAIRKALPSSAYPQTPQLTALRHQLAWQPT